MSALRPLLLAVLHLTLRIFFRRVHVRGREHIPTDGRIIFVLNHPNSLVDPLFVLLLSGYRVSFLAKAPLFGMPVIGWMLRAAQAIPVYRKHDEAGDTWKNQETFAAARRVLAGGGTIAIFPEGISHDLPDLQPLKTGAARIALSAAADGPVHVVPAGLYYSSKWLFRSRALVWFGEPVTLPHTPGQAAEPPAEPVRVLTEAIADRLREVTLLADRAEALDIVARADRVLAWEGRTVAEEVDLRRRLEEGYQTLRVLMPVRLEALATRLALYEGELEAAGIPPRALRPDAYTPVRVTLWTLGRVAECVLLLPLALPGILVHAPSYAIIDRIARSYAKEHADLLATAKILAGLLLFPITWGLAAFSTWWHLGPLWATLAALLGPVTGYAALRFIERVEGFAVAFRAFRLLLLGRRRFLRLTVERDAIRREIRDLGEAIGRT